MQALPIPAGLAGAAGPQEGKEKKVEIPRLKLNQIVHSPLKPLFQGK